MKILIDPIRI